MYQFIQLFLVSVSEVLLSSITPLPSHPDGSENTLTILLVVVVDVMLSSDHACHHNPWSECLVHLKLLRTPHVVAFASHFAAIPYLVEVPSWTIYRSREPAETLHRRVAWQWTGCLQTGCCLQGNWKDR